MIHEEEGRLMAYVDGELAGHERASVETHLGGCADCARTTSRLRAERSALSSALERVDADGAAAARRVREQLAQLGPSAAPNRPATPGRAAGPTRPPRKLPLYAWLQRRGLQAALFVLFVAGGASALVPGSPLRRLIERGGGTPATAPTAAPEAEFAPARMETLQVTISAVPVAGRLRVSLQLPAGTALSVALTDADRATLFADPSSRFTSSDGLLQAEVLSGTVRVELPRGAADVSLEVGGQLYVRVQNGRAQLTMPAADSSDAELTFRIR
jgi:hypothetical protein